MAGIKQCSILSGSKLDYVDGFIQKQLDEGVRNPIDFVSQFLEKLNEAGLTIEAKAIYLNTYLRYLLVRAMDHRISGPERNALVDGISLDDLAEFFNSVDSAENFEEFINSQLPNELAPKEAAEESGDPKSNLNEENENRDDYEEITEQAAKEEQELAERKALESEEDQFEEQDELPLREKIIRNLADKSRVIAPENVQSILRRLNAKGGITLLDNNDQRRSFKFNREKGTISERIGEGYGHELGALEFAHMFEGSVIFENDTLMNFDNFNRSNREDSLREYLGTVGAKFVNDKLITLYGNAMTAAQRGMSLFSMENGKLVLGELAETLKFKNDVFRRFFRRTKDGNSFELGSANLKSLFGQDAKLFLKLSNDDSLLDDQQQIHVAVERPGQEDLVLGNYFNTDYKDIFDGVSGGVNFNNFIQNTIKQINESPDGKIDITEQGIKIRKVFQPNSKSGAVYKIYENDKDRYGKNAHENKAKRLTVSDARKLFAGLGFGVSSTYIDKYASSHAKLAGASFFAVSPFHTSEQIDDIIKRETDINNENPFDFTEINKRENISFIYLRGKELAFEDYFNLIKDNDTVNYYRKANEDKEGVRDGGKRDGMFNVGQSPYLHFRIAETLPIIQKAIESMPRSTQRDTLSADLKMLKIFLFSNVNHYSNNTEDIKRRTAYRRDFNKLYHGDDEVLVSNKWYEEAERNFQEWYSKEADQRVKLSKEYAHKQFGYYPGNPNDPMYYLNEQKQRWAESQANGDTTLFKQLMNKGGIFGNPVVRFFKNYPLYKSFKNDQGQSVEQIWNSDSAGVSTSDNVGFSNVIARPTYNPVVSSSGYRSLRVSSIERLNKWDNATATDVAEDYLEVEWMPMMPHFEIELDENEVQDDTPSPRRGRRPAFQRKYNAPKGKNKTVTAESSADITYELTMDQAKELYNSLLGDIVGELRAMDSPIEVNEGMVIGQVYKDMMRLHRRDGKVSERVLRHEIMHRVTNEVLMPDTQRKLYQEAKMRMLEEPEFGYKSIHEISDRDADEWIAETYDKNYGSYGSNIVRRLPKIVKDFYFFLKELYIKFSGKGSYFNLIAEKLESGSFINHSLNQNGYGGTMANKVVGFDKKALAQKIAPDIALGSRILDGNIQEVAVRVQGSMFGSYVAKNLDYFPVPITYQEALKNTKEDISFDIVDEFNMLPKLEQQFFSGKTEIEDVSELFTDLNIAGRRYLDLSDQAASLYDKIMLYRYFNETASLAIPFYNFKTQAVDNTASLESLENQLEADAKISDSDVNHDKLRNSFERSEISALGTFSEKVKFFLYNTTITPTSLHPVDRKAVDRFFSNVFHSVRNGNDSDGTITMQKVVDAMKKEVNNLSVYNESYVAKSVKAIYDRFFNLDSNESFLSIALNTDPDAKLQAESHMEVLSAILSAQRSVIEQDFLKVEKKSMSTTQMSHGKDFKNKVKDGMIGKLFAKRNSKNRISYVLSKDAKATFFSNGNFRMTSLGGGKVQLYLDGVAVELGMNDFSRGGSHYDLNISSAKAIAEKIQRPTIFAMLHGMGISMNHEAFNGYLAKDTKKATRRDDLVQLMLHSYLVLGRQYIEEGNAKEFKPEDIDFIKKVTESRGDDIAKVVNEELRFDNISEAIDPDMESRKKVFSPTAFHARFEALGAQIALNSYTKGSGALYLIDGSKEVVDKFPTTMHNVLNKLKKFRLKATRRLEKLNDELLLQDPGATEITMDEYIAMTEGAIYSGIYKNAIIDGRIEIDNMYYFKAMRNNSTNRGRSFNEMTDSEFHKNLLHFMVGDGFSKGYFHPMEIQADRGYLPVLKLAGNEKLRYHPSKVKGKWDIGKSREALLEIRKIPFHHAANVMKDIYTVLDDPFMVASVEALQKTGNTKGILQMFDKLNEGFDEMMQQPGFSNQVTPRKHYVKVNGKFVLPPVLRSRMAVSEDEFITYVKEAYLEFAEYTHKLLGHDLSVKVSQFGFNESDFENTELDDPTFYEKKKILLFKNEVKDKSKYDKLSLDEKINLYHPGLYSMFLTFYINHNHLNQATTGDMFLYKADKDTGLDNPHSYMTDYSKRQGTFTTPKIEGVYREVLPDGRVINPNGLGDKINVAYFNDMKYVASTSENAEFYQAFAAANQNTDGSSYDQESTDGIIFTNFIFRDQLRASYGGPNGIGIDSLLKFNAHHFDHSNGNLHLPKGMAMVMTPELLDNSNAYFTEMLRAQLKPAVIVSGESRRSLWDHYLDVFRKEGHAVAQAKTLELYRDARNGLNGLALEGDVIHFMAPASTNKGTGKGMNSIIDDSISGDYAFNDEIISDQISTDGFGIILDLQKDINKSDLDVSLSTQMMFLLGINGDNYLEASRLYVGLKNMSAKELGSIVDDIAKTFNKANQKGDPDNKAFLENKEALRKWFMKEIKSAYTMKSDYGLIYQLVENFSDGSVSHPMLFEEIYSKVASRVSKSITRRVPGFKAPQMPAHNFVMLYQNPDNGRWITAKDARRLGKDPAQLQARNIQYSQIQGDSLSDTEIISGNIFAGRYGMDPNFSIDELFTINAGGVAFNVEANSFDEINSQVAFADLKNAIDAGEQIDWADNPVFNHLLSKKEIPNEIEEAFNSGALTPEMNQQIFYIFRDRIVEMNKMLYGVMTRIPGTGKNSSSPVRIVAFVQGFKNGIFTPPEWLLISGSDYDGDTVQFWNFGSDSKDGVANQSLLRVRKILKDKKNANEIFSMINLGFMEDQAKAGKKEMVSKGKGFVMGSLKTMTEIKGNNSVGTSLTGINATQAKVHSYTTIAKTMFDDLVSKLEGKAKSSAEKILATKPSLVFSFNGKQANTGPIAKDANGDYRDSEGNYIYKWNEVLTNAAIDNPKHLFMNFTGLNSYNSGIQQAMTFLGFSPTVIVDEVLKNPIVKEIYEGVAQLDDTAEESRGNLAKYIRRVGLEVKSSKEVDGKTVETVEKKRGKDWLKEWYHNKQIGNIRDHFLAKGNAVDFNDREDIYKFLLFMEDIQAEIDNIRKFIKATDPIPGKSGDQDVMINNLIESLNHNMTKASNDYFYTADDVLNYINRFDVEQSLVANPLNEQGLVKLQANTATVHPRVVMMTVPHLREYVKRHLEFSKMKEAHILYSPEVMDVKEFVNNSVSKVAMRLQRNRALLNRSLYKYVNGMFLEYHKNYEFENNKFDLSTLKGRKAFRDYFNDYIRKIKEAGSDNEFIKRLEVIDNEIVFPGSENMQQESKLVPQQYFQRLVPAVKEAFLLYELTGSGSQLSYKKGSYVTFMDGDSHKRYNRFLQRIEAETDVIFESDEHIKAFTETFFSDNPSINNQVYKSNVLEHANDNYNYGFISYSDGRTPFSEYHIRAEKVKKAGVIAEKDDEKGAQPFYVVKGYSEEQERFITKLYKSESAPNAQAPYKVKLKEQYSAFDKSVNPYQRNNPFPMSENEERIVPSLHELEDRIKEKGVTDSDLGEYYISDSFQKAVVNKDGTIKIKQYSFNARKGSPAARRKAKAVAKVVQKAFPNVNMRFVQNMSGVYGEAAGFVHNGTVFLNLDNIGLDTPIHEFGHIFIDVLEKTDRKLYESISSMIVRTKDFKEISKRYEQFNNSESDNIKETFVTLLGHHFRDNLAGKLTGLTSQEKSGLQAHLSDFINWVKQQIRQALGSLNIGKRYINDTIIENLEASSDLNDMFTAIGGAVLSGKVITDLSTRELNELSRDHLKPQQKMTDRQVNQKINELIEKGIIKNYC